MMMGDDDDDADADAIQSFLDDNDSAGASSYIPASRPPISCCCGNVACAFLKHNESALDGLERDVSTAARLGKVSFFVHVLMLLRIADLVAGALLCSAAVTAVGTLLWCDLCTVLWRAAALRGRRPRLRASDMHSRCINAAGWTTRTRR